MVLRYILMISMIASVVHVSCKAPFYTPKKYAHLQQKKLGRLGKNRSKILKKYHLRSQSELPAYRTDSEWQWPDRYGYNPMGVQIEF